MKNKLLGLLIITLISMSPLLAQTRISGVVTSQEDGTPIPFASVFVKGTNVAATTDSDGKYLINVPDGATTLSFNVIGMKSIDVDINGRSVINVTMQQDAVALDDVLIVAYGTAKKESFTGSAQVIKSDVIEKRTIANVTKALDGMAAGIQSTSGSGQPGTGAAIIIRGFGSLTASTSPLYVVDGVPYDGEINAINPNDIESITIIKDASAGALYGARGANGVVMVTTKRGSEGDVTVNFKANLGVSSWGIQRYETMNPYEWTEDVYFMYKNKFIKNGVAPELAGIQALNEMAVGPTRIFGARQQYNPFSRSATDLIDHSTGKIYDGTTLKWNENWLDEATQDTPIRQEYQMVVSGGTPKTNYMFSLGYLNEDGLVKSTNFERFSGRTNVDSKITDWFRAGLNINFAANKSNSTVLSDPEASMTSYSNVFHSCMMMPPVYPFYQKDDSGKTVYDSNGKPLFDWGEDRPAGAAAGWNPIANLKEDRYFGMTDNVSSRMFLEYKGLEDSFLKGVKIAANFGFDYSNGKSKTYYNPFFGNGKALNGLIEIADERTFSYTFNQIVSWDRTFNNHHFDIMAGHELYRNEYQYLLASKTGFPFGGLYELDAATNIRNARSYSDEYVIESYLSRLNYDYRDKYYFSASYRRDGTSRFNKEVRWGDFWSVGASWRISQESFMQDFHWINNLTLKASYGVQGNDNIGSLYAWQALYSLRYANQSFPGAVVESLENANLKWEKNNNLNIGIESRLFDRLSISTEYYFRKTEDMLMDYPMAVSLGFSEYSKNIGSMENRGLELTLSYDILKSKDLFWNMTFMGSTVSNKVKKLADKPEIITGSYIIREGETLRSFYLAESAGVDPETGDKLYWVWDTVDGVKGEKYKTSSHQKALQCREVGGSRIPDLFGSLSTSLKYKSFDFSLLTTYSIGGHVLDNVYRNLMYNTYVGNNGHKDRLTKSWRKPGDDTRFPRIDNGAIFNSVTTKDELFSASYFAIKNISFGYNLPSNLVQKAGLKNVRVSLTADNLHIFTALKGMDPQYNFTGGTDFGYTPARTISMGLDIRF